MPTASSHYASVNIPTELAKSILEIIRKYSGWEMSGIEWAMEDEEIVWSLRLSGSRTEL